MDNTINRLTPTPSVEAEAEGRRDALRKLGKYAAYAAPFTLLAANTKAQGPSGAGSGGRTSSAPPSSSARR